MYYRLKAEIIYKGYNVKEFASLCGISYSAFLRKLSYKRDGKNDFTLDEAIRIRDLLKSDLSLEELFTWEDRT